MTDVIMPTLGLTMEEGTITEWLKQEGDAVNKDEPLFVVETDKAAMEVPSPASGVLQKIIAQVGVTVPVRQPIAVIAEPGQGPAGRAQQPTPTLSETKGNGAAEATPVEAAPAAAQPLQPSA